MILRTYNIRNPVMCQDDCEIKYRRKSDQLRSLKLLIVGVKCPTSA